MELWLTEYQTKNLSMSTRVKETLYTGRSDFQEITVVDTEQFGRLLTLDGIFQTSVFDEFIYHEMITHVPFFTHPNPRKVLIIGGGDGGSAREMLRHSSIEEVKMVEIDGLVVEVCKKYLPEISVVLRNPENHPRFELKIGDGIKFMQQAEGYYDIIIVDCSDPVGPGQGLFSRAFYEDVYKALKPDGLFVQQTDSPLYQQRLIKRLHDDLSLLFPITRLYLAPIPTYPGGLHCFTMGSKKYDPLNVDINNIPENFVCRYYSKDLQNTSFVLPPFIKDFLNSNPNSI